MHEDSSEEDARPVRYAARQPVLAADETVIGYKLLFRSGVVDHFAWNHCDGASRTAIEISSLLGLSVMCDNRLAFIHCTRDVLLENHLTFLPGDKVVAEIGCEVEPDAAVEAACGRLKRAGYKIALDNFKAGDSRAPLVEHADFLAVDFQQATWDEILQVTHAYHNRDLGLLALNVDSRQEFESGQKAGFHYFQGFFFRKPEMMRTRTMPSHRMAYLRLLRALSKPDLDWDEVEDLIKRDAPLYYRLLRYLNSALFGMRGEVRSVSQALVLLGESELRRWCRLAGAFELSAGRPSDLILSALVRARFGELMQDHVEHGNTDLFLLGLLSLMDAILQIPMGLVLEGLPLEAGSRTMLLDNEGPLLPFYRLVWAVERGAWGAVVRACSQLGVSEEYVAECFSRAMGWAQSVTAGF